MSIRNLDKMFEPTSLAVIGASATPGRIGRVVLDNMRAAGFTGPLYAVNPKYRQIDGQTCYPNVAALPQAPDLAVICTAPPSVPGIIRALGEKGTRATLVITAGTANAETPDRAAFRQAILNAAQPFLMRVLGPNSIGLLVPRRHVNASFAHIGAIPGRLAFISQSGALCSIVLDWAQERGVGFSHFIALGDSVDVDFGDVIDYVAADPHTGGILLYIESITAARKFLSAVRGAARTKPIVAVKAGRNPRAAEAAASHSGAMAGGDEVYSAALQRAGVVRVDGVEELFSAVETLAHMRKLPGDRLAIVTNGGGPGVMAVDTLIARGGELAHLAPETLLALNRVLPPTWSHGNPVDIAGDADAARYTAALNAVLADPDVDAVLVMHAPTAVVEGGDTAQAVIAAARQSAKNLLACWPGGLAAMAARRSFTAAGVPNFETPEQAARAFAHMIAYRRNQKSLMETPAELPEDFTPDIATVRGIIDRALAAGRFRLTEMESKEVLAAYRIPTVPTEKVETPQEAMTAARRLGYPVVLKILSPDIDHKSDVGGVSLNLDDAAEVRQAADAMLARVKRLKPDARIEGFTVQSMLNLARAHELFVGALTDPIFGPAIVFGQGGVRVEAIDDRAVALPPLNMHLAEDLISRTRVNRLLFGFRDLPVVNRPALAALLVRVAQLVADHAELMELDINPLFADTQGLYALDARILLAPSHKSGPDRLAIRPYPKALEERVTLKTGEVLLLRPIRPEDEPAHYELFNHISPEDYRLRFFSPMRALPHREMARFTQIDYEREMAFVAQPLEGGTTYGVVRAVTDPDNRRAEFAILVRSDFKGHGLGEVLMKKIIGYCRQRGTAELVGDILRENQAMRALANELGFRIVPGDFSEVVEMRLDLTQPALPAG